MVATMQIPQIIQGGMGVAVSNWQLANAVSKLGQLGVVSGTALDSVLVRRLQDGDPGGYVRRALESFPVEALSARALELFFLPNGRAQGAPYKRVPMPSSVTHPENGWLSVLGGFVEVHLARAGHSGMVGINLLTKIQMTTLPTLYGALLAGVHVVLMGAGIPRDIPDALTQLSSGQVATLKLEVTGSKEAVLLEFDPFALMGARLELPRPAFLPIVSSNVLATMLARRGADAVQGFVVEAPTAGGHNAPPRGAPLFDERGQPVYSAKDEVDLEALKKLGLPFWLAGSCGSPEALQRALQQGAAGIQVGTLFAHCAESGFAGWIKDRVLDEVAGGRIDVLTDARASPTGFPFKVVNVPETLSDDRVYAARDRVCDLGYLREAYLGDDGNVGFRCAAEPVDAYLAKGGKLEDTVGRKCLCNSLLASIGLPQIQRGAHLERALVTSGDDLASMGVFLERYGATYSARDVVTYLLNG
jgi:NAD(P)H-dependent flavin oxidoreductase YrpB (nitropropane dioxygenase family)